MKAVEHWSCGECKYWVMLQDAEATGTCRRHPPVPTPPEIALLAVFPITISMSWCGEFKRRY